jgi:DNA repair exonuclease SbcCD ATPase subunit
MAKSKSVGEGQTIEQLKKRFELLNETRIKIETQRNAAQEQLAQLREAAIAQFGTDDVEKLKAQLAEIKAENERQRAAYEQSLNAIDERLAQIDKDTEKGASE